MSLFTTIKDKLNKLRSRSKKYIKEGQWCQFEDLTERQSGKATVSNFFDGMGPVTASIIIHRRIDKYIYAVYGIEGLLNNKRFYIDREIEASGSIIKTSLVDKQSGKTRILYYRSAGRTSPQVTDY